MNPIIKEFKEFAVKGNVMDLAVGVIIGGAFGKIVSSLVTDIIMPPLGMILSGIDISKKVFVLKQATLEQSAVTINYGIFLNNVLDFLIVAFAIFILIRQLNRFRKKKETEPEVSTQEKLLMEIRDELKKR